MALGMGYTVEGQITGHEEEGGIQIKAFASKLPARELERIKAYSVDAMAAPAASMGLGAGGKMFDSPRREKALWTRAFNPSGRPDSNRRPSPWQGDALPLSHAREVSHYRSARSWGTSSRGTPDPKGRRRPGPAKDRRRALDIAGRFAGSKESPARCPCSRNLRLPSPRARGPGPRGARLPRPFERPAGRSCRRASNGSGVCRRGSRRRPLSLPGSRSR